MRVLAMSFIILALPLLIDSFLFFQHTYEVSIEDAKEELQELANYRAYSITELEPVKFVLLDELSYLLAIEKALNDKDLKTVQQQLLGLDVLNLEYTIYILDVSSDVNYHVLASTHQEEIGREFLSYVQLKDVILWGQGDFFRYIYSDKEKKLVPTLFVARAIYSQNKTPLGIVMVGSNIEERIKPMLEKGGEKREIQFALVDSEGIVFAATDPRFERQIFKPISYVRREEIINSGQLGDYPLASQIIPIIKDEDSSYFQFLFDGQVQIGYRAASPRAGISLVAYSPKSLIFGEAIRHFVIIYSIYGFILIAGGGITYWITLWMSRPLRQLSHLMGRVGGGDYEVRFKPEPLGFEINILGNIFNQTLETLLKNTKDAGDERVMKETYRKELAIGQEVQRNLFPEKITSIKGVEIAEAYIPAQEVSGDFYDVFSRPSFHSQSKEELILTIADAAGKGVSSCIYALGLRSILRAYATRYEDVAKLMEKSNNLFLNDTGDTGMFVTVLMGIYHPDTHWFDYYSCGHVPGIVRRANGHLITLSHTGMAMGLKELSKLESERVDLYPGDVVLFYTDGLTDAVNRKNQKFTFSYLQSLLQQRAWKTAKEVVTGLTNEVRAFKKGAPQMDDITILAMRIEEEP